MKMIIVKMITMKMIPVKNNYNTNRNKTICGQEQEKERNWL